MANLKNKIALLRGAVAIKVAAEAESHSGVWIDLDNDIRIYAAYWRLIQKGNAQVSGFDHLQKYGLPQTIDAIAILSKALLSKTVERCIVDETTGDLKLSFSDSTHVEIFNFTGNEVWEVKFPDGSSQLSNYFRPHIDA